MNSVVGFFVGVFQATLGFLGIYADAPPAPLNFGIDGNAGAQEVLTPQQVIDEYSALPKGIANQPSTIVRTSIIQFKSPEGWKKEGASAYVTPDFKKAVQADPRYIEASNKNPAGTGARVEVRYEEQVVAENIDNPDAFADFTLSVLKSCSNCVGVKKLSVDGNSTVVYGSYAEDHGGNFFLTGRVAHKTVTVVFNYADSPEKYKPVFEALVQSIRFVATGSYSADGESGENPMASGDHGLTKFSDQVTGISISYPFTWNISGSEKPGSDYHIFARAVNPKYQGKPDTDVPSEKLLVYRMNGMPCSGELVFMAGKGAYDTGWSASGMGGSWIRTICIPGGMPLYISATALQESTKSLLDAAIESFSFIRPEAK